jgi:hypothetical protein
MRVPPEQIARMLADGSRGVFVSMVCLSAALAVKRGCTSVPPIKDLRCSSGPTPEGLLQATRKVHEATFAQMRAATPTPEQLDAAIALYTAHLKAAGVTFTYGQDN